jgi:hypothetical protein
MRRQSSYREFDKRCMRAEMKEKYPLTGGYMTYETVRRCAQLVSAMVVLSLPGATAGVWFRTSQSPALGEKIEKVQQNTAEVLGTVVLPTPVK